MTKLDSVQRLNKINESLEKGLLLELLIPKGGTLRYKFLRASKQLDQNPEQFKQKYGQGMAKTLAFQNKITGQFGKLGHGWYDDLKDRAREWSQRGFIGRLINRDQKGTSNPGVTSVILHMQDRVPDTALQTFSTARQNWLAGGGNRQSNPAASTGVSNPGTPSSAPSTSTTTTTGSASPASTPSTPTTTGTLSGSRTQQRMQQRMQQKGAEVEAKIQGEHQQTLAASQTARELFARSEAQRQGRGLRITGGVVKTLAGAGLIGGTALTLPVITAGIAPALATAGALYYGHKLVSSGIRSMFGIPKPSASHPGANRPSPSNSESNSGSSTRARRTMYYKALNSKGIEVTGTIDATDPNDALRQIKLLNLHPTDLR